MPLTQEMADQRHWALPWARRQATLAGVSLKPGLGAEGWEAWLRLDQGWESLAGVDGGKGLRGNYLAETKDIRRSSLEDGDNTGMNREQGLDRQMVVQPGLGRARDSLAGLNEGQE